MKNFPMALLALAAGTLLFACPGPKPSCNNTCAAAGATQCSGTQVQTCIADTNGCLALSAAATCGSQQFCSASSNACVACNNTCSAGATRCSGAQVQTCAADANGCFAFGAAQACPQGENCNASQNKCVTAVACGAPNVTAATSPAGPPSDPGTCSRPVGQSTLPAGQVQHLGIQTVGQIVQFNVPPGTGSFALVAQQTSAAAEVTYKNAQGQTVTRENIVTPVVVKDSNGGTFFDFNNPPADGTTAKAWYPAPAASTGVFAAPNTSPTLDAWSTSGAPSGTWSASLDDLAHYCASVLGSNCLSGGSPTDTYDVSVITRPAAPSVGTVDVAFYLVTNSFTAAAAASSPNIARMVSTLQTIYARAGLCLGNVTFFDVQPWAKTKYATGVDATKTGPCDNLDQMFTLSQAGNTLNFFLVDDITQQSSGGTLSVVGIDGSIPGPSSIGGTVHSGAVVNGSDIGKGTCGSSLDFVGCGSDEVAYITAHEGGHWMGLFHTSERYGNAFDPISDTGQCVCTSCVTGARLASCAQNNPPAGTTPTVLTGSDCNKGGQCDGSQYLMFWVIDNASVGDFSPQQGQVVRANAVAR